jgi:hypothetical protein
MKRGKALIRGRGKGRTLVCEKRQACGQGARARVVALFLFAMTMRLLASVCTRRVRRGCDTGPAVTVVVCSSVPCYLGLEHGD